MLDLGGFPPGPDGADVQVFTVPATVTNTQWQTWRRKPGVSMLAIIAIGGGGGGGGGFTGIATSARGGGGGGGGSGNGRAIVPACFLPDRLYVQVGAGGVGVGSGGGTAPSGILSMVSISPDNSTATNLVITSGAVAATGGGTGTAAAVGAAGAASTIPTSPASLFCGWFFGQAGSAGGAGGAVAGGNGTTVNIPAVSPIMSGAGGAGTTSADFVGGTVQSIANSYISEQRPATPASGSVSGSSGPQLWKPFFSFGGLGGSSSNTGVGGNGGKGACGAGGGGGGGGTTGGVGGDGGSGIVVIVGW